MRKENKSAKSVMLNSLGVGITYALMLTILSVITKVKVSPYDMMQYNMALDVSYSPLSIFINGLVIGFLCTYIVGFKKIYEKDNIYLAIIKKAISTIFLGYIVVLLIVIVITL